MKPLVKTLLLTFCLLFFLSVSAQNKLGSDGTISGSSTLGSASLNAEDNGSSNATHFNEFGTASSIYFNDWAVGKVILKDQTVYEDWLLRYNIQTQQMQFISEGDTSALGNPEEISSITLEQHTFLYDKFICENDITRSGYLELLVDGNCKLFLHRCISYRYVDECAEPGAIAKEEYFMAKRYFISENDGIATLLPDKKKELISMLDDEDKYIKTFIKDNKIKLCNEDDLKELFSYYNSE